MEALVVESLAMELDAKLVKDVLGAVDLKVSPVSLLASPITLSTDDCDIIGLVDVLETVDVVLETGIDTGDVENAILEDD